MEITWGAFWQKSRKWLKTGWLITAGIIAIYIGAIQPMNNAKGIASEKATGLGTVQWEPVSLWRAPSYERFALSRQAQTGEGVIGGVPGGRAPARKVQQAQMMAYLSTSDLREPSDDRKLVRTTSIDLLVKSPTEAVEKIRTITERVGGFLVKSQTNGAQDATNASLTVRVPVARFEGVRAEIRKLGLRVESEQVDAEDVTKQYVDQQARLRNLRAQETQYLAILKQARTIKDTIEVSDKLNGVRGEIEQQQAEFEALSRQVETVAITVSLHSEAEAQVFGLHWRPLYELKLAVMQGLEGLADYATAMLVVVFYLPAILLWLATILVGAALGWRILRLAARVLFPRKKPATAVT